MSGRGRTMRDRARPTACRLQISASADTHTQSPTRASLDPPARAVLNHGLESLLIRRLLGWWRAQDAVHHPRILDRGLTSPVRLSRGLLLLCRLGEELCQRCIGL